MARTRARADPAHMATEDLASWSAPIVTKPAYRNLGTGLIGVRMAQDIRCRHVQNPLD